MNEVPILFVKQGGTLAPDEHAVLEAARVHFTAIPPPCAKPYLPIEGYDVLFRVDS